MEEIINKNDSRYNDIEAWIQMYVCVCNAVTEREIRQAVELGARSLCDLKHGLGIASNCGKCVSCAHEVLSEEMGKQIPPYHGQLAFGPA
ncbi:MAG TPA: (2Fe-2S)-binding protein [Burkholderiales bacterium]|nr:(2Fe-2S)-binding protein [Burkholderiales bacterium]